MVNTFRLFLSGYSEGNPRTDIVPSDFRRQVFGPVCFFNTFLAKVTLIVFVFFCSKPRQEEEEEEENV